MFKKISLIIIILLFLSLIYYSYYYFQEHQAPASSALRAIPQDASIIIESKKSHDTWSLLSETNIIWEELLTTPYYQELNKQLLFFDSIYVNNLDVNNMLQNQPLFISAHSSGANIYDFLFTFTMPLNFTKENLDQLIKDIANKSTSFSEKIYDGVTITAIIHAPQKSFYYTLHEGIFIGSFTAILVEDAIRQLNSKTSLLDEKGFKTVYQTSGFKTDANIFVHYKKLPSLLTTYLSSTNENFYAFLSDFAEWTELDLKIKPNALMLNGYTYTEDSTNNFLTIFLKQQPQEMELTRVIPDKTAILIYLGFSDFNSYYKDYLNYLSKTNSIYNYEKNIEKINQECNCDINKTLLSWIGNEIGVVYTEPPLKETKIEKYKFVVIHSKNMEQTTLYLDEIMTSQTNQDTLFDEYKSYLIKKLPLNDVWSILLGDVFEGINENYFTVINNYVIFGNSKIALKEYINYYLSENTLYKDVYFNNFTEHLSSTANIFIYSNIARSINIYPTFTNDKYADILTNHEELLQKFEAIGIQLIADKKNFLYNNIYLKYNPIYKQETSSLWEALLETSISSKPYLVTNHQNQAKEIFVQDDNNKIYLLSNTGKTLWKKQLSEKIISEIHQVDVFKNKRLQLLFNTASKIYLLDRNGNPVEGFPVELKSKATQGLNIFDYDNNKTYRILVACKDNKIYNYDQQGKIVKGWEFDKTKEVVKQPIQHCMIDRKDYIIVVDEKGNVYALDRKGKARIDFKEKITVSKNNLFYIEKGKDLSNTSIVCTDSIGDIISYYFNGNKKTTSIKTLSKNHFFNFQDINFDGNREYIFIEENELSVYDQNKTPIFGYSFDSTITCYPSTFRLSDNNVEIGIVSKSTNEIYLINHSGLLHAGFPLFGSTYFGIGDINKDGTMDLVVSSNDGHIYAYVLE